jgi:two-component system, NarL family, sensor histidine kinase BarA
MARKLVKFSLALKLRILLGAAVLAIIVAALAVPWYFMELLEAQRAQRDAAELTRLRLNEFLRDHPDPNREARSEVALLYTMAPGAPGERRKGPSFLALEPNAPPEGALDSWARDARDALRRNSDQDLAILQAEDERGHPLFRCFRAVRVEASCIGCHGPAAPGNPQFRAGDLVGLIDVSLPPPSGTLIWLTRGAFVGGAVLATVLAFVVFTAITQTLILKPVRQLREVADRVTEGSLDVRSTIRTGDELQRLGESFNEMLAAIGAQHERLRAANRALDLKLSEVAEANVALFEANKIKTEFLANVSHELRTPLTSIIGFSDLLTESQDSRVSRYGRNIATAAKSLLSMINDLLDLARIEAGRAVVHLDKVSVTDACQTLLTLMTPLAEQKKLALRGDLAADVPIVTTDAGKLQQILYNLLSNAVKFTPPGGSVTLATAQIQTQRSGQTIPEVEISVADTGPGISEAEQSRIFEKFYQADRALTREAGGAGLGLSIAKELTLLLGGRLALKSEPGHGATFTVTLPIEPPPAIAEAPPEKA